MIAMRRAISHILASTPAGRIACTLARKFVRRDDGATMVEFGIVVFPFLALLFAIIETALVFFAGQVLETAVADSARLILTGQAQALNLNAATFKNQVCGRIFGLFDCQGGLQIDVRTFSSFANSSIPKPVDPNTGLVDTTGFTFQPGVAGDIVVMRFVYKWPTFVRTFGLDVSDLSDGYRLMMATAAFRNEPFTWNGGN
jgi:Flp pilus assembly protein TadG